MKGLPEDAGITLIPITYDGAMEQSTSAAHLYVDTMIEITRGMREADRDMFFHFAFVSMFEKMESNDIHLDYTELASASTALVDETTYQQLVRAVENALDRAEFARKSVARLRGKIGAERSIEVREQAMKRITRNTARECMQIVEDNLVI